MLLGDLLGDFVRFPTALLLVVEGPAVEDVPLAVDVVGLGLTLGGKIPVRSVAERKKFEYYLPTRTLRWL